MPRRPRHWLRYGVGAAVNLAGLAALAQLWPLHG
jgi:hypothetical protein